MAAKNISLTNNDTGSQPQAPEPAVRRRRGRPAVNSNMAKRDEIMKAARELMQTVRPSKFTKAMVCTKAGVDPTLLTYHFGDLDNLFVEILKEMIGELNERIITVAVKRATPEVRLRRRIDTLADFILANPGFFELLVKDVYYGESEWSKQALKDITEPAYRGVSKVIAKGREEGRFRDDFDDRMLYAVIIGLTEFISSGAPVFALLYPGKHPSVVARHFKKFVADLIFNGIRAKDARQDSEDPDNE